MIEEVNYLELFLILDLPGLVSDKVRRKVSQGLGVIGPFLKAQQFVHQERTNLYKQLAYPMMDYAAQFGGMLLTVT